MENTGFMLGMMTGGAAVGKVAKAALKLAKPLQEFKVAAMAEGLTGDAVGALLNGTKAGEQYMMRLPQELQKAAKALRTKQATLQKLQLAPGVLGESLIETRDFRDTETEKLRNHIYSDEQTEKYINRATEDMRREHPEVFVLDDDGDISMTEEGQAQALALAKQYQEEDIQKGRTAINKASVIDFGLNATLLALTDGMSWGRVFNKNIVSESGKALQR
jgi:hypothetical protein